MAQGKENERELFETIVVRGEMSGDAGVVAFGESIKEFEESLRERYVKAGRADIPKAELMDIEKELSDGWPFFDKIAALSGKLEVVSHEDVETLTGLLSNIALENDEGTSVYENDETGNRHCFVYDARLESSRIVVDPIFGEDKVLRDVRIYYEFKIPQDKDEDVLFYAYPDDLSHHAYGEAVSSVEARTRLQYKWSEQFEILESAILDDTRELPERLIDIVTKLKDALADDEFRKYAELFVNDELALNQERPYVITAKKGFDLLGDIESETAEWMPVTIEGELKTDIYYPDIRFTRAGADDPNAIEACIHGETFNDADGDKPEVIAVTAENILGFQRTWARDSLANLAFKIIQDERAAHRTVNEVEPSINLEYSSPDEEQEESDYLEQLELLESVLEMMQREVKAAESKTYSTIEAAQAYSNKITTTLTSMLNGTIATSGVSIEVMGNALRTNHQEGEGEDADHARNQVWYSPDPENPVRGLNFGESIKGIIDPHEPVRPLVKSREDESGNMTHWALPHLAVRLPDRSTGEIQLGGMLFSRITAEEWVAVPLSEEDADIKITMLEQARSSRTALSEAANQYGEDSPLMKRILSIEEALYNEDKNDFTHLQPSRIAGFAKDLIAQIGREKATKRAKAAAPALKVLEGMFANRTIISKSDVYKKTTDGFVVDDERIGVDAAWQVIDFTLSDDGHEIVMFVGSLKQPDIARYVPLSSVVSFRF